MSQPRPEDPLFSGRTVLRKESVEWVVPLHSDGLAPTAQMVGVLRVPVVDAETPARSSEEFLTPALGALLRPLGATFSLLS